MEFLGNLIFFQILSILVVFMFDIEFGFYFRKFILFLFF